MANEEYELEVLLENDKTPSLEEDTIGSVLPQEKPKVAPLDIEEDNLRRILSTREQISQVKNSLSGIVDSIADNPSLFTRASNVWGAWPVWQKIGGGLVLTAPAILVGFAANIGSLLVIGGATGIIYSATGMVLEDHHACNVNIKQRLKEGIISIADVLELTIVALDEIRLRLAKEVAKFKAENRRLAASVSDMGDQIHTLKTQIEIFVETERFLRIDKQKLEGVTTELQGAITDQSALLEKNQKELTAVNEDYIKIQGMLAEKVVELRKVRETMASEIGKVKKIASALTGAVDTLSGVVVEDQRQRQVLQGKLTKLLSEKDESLSRIVDKLGTTAHDQEMARIDLSTSNQRYKELLDRQEEQLKKLDLLLAARAEAVTAVEVRQDNNKASSVVGHTIFSGTPVAPTGQPAKVEETKENSVVSNH